jgi:hypothetical protein
MSGRRRFFSGTSESQAAIEAAAALGVPVAELAYRAVDKRGALRPGRVVIEVDPDNPRRAAEAAAPASATTVAGEPAAPARHAAPAERPQREERLRADHGERDRGGYRGGERGADRGERGGYRGAAPRRERHDDGPGEGRLVETAGREAAAPLADAAGAAEAAEALVALGGLDVAATVELADDTVRVDFAGPGRAALVGRQAELLRSCEYLLRRMVRDVPEGGIVADSGGYRAEREESLRRRAAAVAEEVRRSGEPVLLEPLAAAERRIVHLAIQDEPGVASASEGDGETKRIRVFAAG